jgi:peroxiredoxin
MFLLLAVTVAAPGCVSAEQVRASQPVLELSLVRADGAQYELGALLTKPTLLFMFATYDTASQFELTRLSHFATTEPRVDVIGVAAQPDAKTFLKLFQEALSVPFALYFDPTNQLLLGKTAVGKLDAVPAFVALDPEGHIRAVRYGPATESQLRELVDLAAQP